MTIIDHHIVRLLMNIRDDCNQSVFDVGKVLTDSLVRAQMQLDAKRAADVEKNASYGV